MTSDDYKFIQEYFSHFKSLFIFWNFFDTTLFFAVLIPVAFILGSRRIGTELFYITATSLLVNKVLKYLFLMPRPCQVDPDIGILCLETPSFPSGAAQTAAILAGIVFLETKNVFYRIGIVIFSFMLCFSRVFLGVHYPMDIAGGLFVGSLVVIIYHKVFPLFYQISFKQKIAVLSFFPIVTLPFFPLVGIASLIVGIGVLKVFYSK